jgi:hypothetical protein
VGAKESAAQFRVCLEAVLAALLVLADLCRAVVLLEDSAAAQGAAAGRVAAGAVAAGSRALRAAQDAAACSLCLGWRGWRGGAQTACASA